MILLIAVLGGIIASALVTAQALRLLGRRGVLDVPNHRSSHQIPTVRGGGIGLAFGTLVALAIDRSRSFGSTDVALFVAGISFGTIGFVDDLTSGISIRTRMVLQLVAALIVMTLIRSHHSFGVVPLVLAGFLVTVWIISFVNAFNFMDGINGISCAEGIVAGVTIGLIARYEHQYALQAAAFTLAAGAIGFAPFNYPKARLFLGDVGSYFMGSWIATMVVIGLQASIPVEAMFAPVVLYMADTGLTLARRVLRHEAWHEAHRQHTYQQLVDRGWSHTQTTGLVFVVVALSSALGSISLFDSIQARLVADVGIAVLTVGYLTLPSLIDHFWDETSSPGHVASDG
jgi:UDP-GlcNAc:undecaprenyl-phosphate GlcNAc-1-phosphate transferase